MLKLEWELFVLVILLLEGFLTKLYEGAPADGGREAVAVRRP